MNYKSLFAATACAALVFTSCSNDIPEPNGPVNGEEGQGFISLAINLPAISGTRAANDNFDDGDVSEYYVKDAKLVVFKGTSEAEAKVQNIYDIADLRPWNDNADSNITTTAQVVCKVNEAPSEASNVYLMVLLNVPEGFVARNWTNKKLSEIVTIAKENINFGDSKHNFFMSNAPRYVNGVATTLVKLNEGDIYTTKEDAANAPATKVYVERGVAKATVSTPEAKELKLGDETFQVSLKSWGLDVVNKQTYWVRNVTSFDSWKSLGNRFYSDESNRIYWGIDPNYSTNPEAGFTRVALNNLMALDQPGYCLENTFDLNQQYQNQTTSVVFKGAFERKQEDGSYKAETFYTVGSVNNVAYTAEKAKTLIISQACKVLGDKKLADKYAVSENAAFLSTAGDNTLAATDVTYGGEALSGDEIAELNDAIGTFHTYVDGICYYRILVKHFGNDLTPWNPGDDSYGSGNEGKWLGRYGMLRNNWYEVNVSEILNLGDATLPDPKPVPDDETNYYLNFEVNIYSWAKRVQNEEL